MNKQSYKTVIDIAILFFMHTFIKSTLSKCFLQCYQQTKLLTHFFPWFFSLWYYMLFALTWFVQILKSYKTSDLMMYPFKLWNRKTYKTPFNDTFPSHPPPCTSGVSPVCVWISHRAAVNKTPMINAANEIPTTVNVSRPWTLTTCTQSVACFPAVPSPAGPLLPPASEPDDRSVNGNQWMSIFISHDTTALCRDPPPVIWTGKNEYGWVEIWVDG